MIVQDPAMVTSDNPAASRRRLRLQPYLTLEPVLLAALTLLAIVAFVAVSGLSRLYHAQQMSLGSRWFTRGVSDLDAGHFDPAVLEFHTALRYSRDNYSYQLHLAQALLGLNHTSESYAYLINLWEREPENGLVNLLLARLAARDGTTEQVQRYYHNAIYATWPNDRELQRREARIELIEYLLKIKADEQAQSELIALAANLGDDPAQQIRVGNLFMRAQDYQHALAAYLTALKLDHRNETAMAGAGWAAFETGQYSVAQRYLQSAIDIAPGDAQSRERLKTTELVLQMDPFSRGLSAAHRNRIVVDAFAAAGDRMKSCGISPSTTNANSGAKSTGSPAALSSPPNLADSWAELKPRINERGLERDPDLVESAMDLVFESERETAATCGNTSELDQALLLVAKLHEGR